MSSSIKRSQPLHFCFQRLGNAIDIFPCKYSATAFVTDELTA